jgi:hypothetical protein
LSQQKSPLTQSVLLVQLVLQLVAPHTNGAHGVVEPGLHAPVVSQLPSVVPVPLVQEAVPHAVPTAQVPWHLPL